MMEVREARAEEADQVVALIRGTLPSEVRGLTLYDCAGIVHYVRENIRAASLHADMRYFVAIEDKCIRGAIEIQLSPADVFVKYVAVAVNARRRGLGNQLLAAVLKAFPDKTSLSLHVLDTNLPALAWYEELGMRRVSSLRWYKGELPPASGLNHAIVSGFAQYATQFERYGFGMIVLKDVQRTANIGIMGEEWLRITSWDDLKLQGIVAALRHLWPRRRVLVISDEDCPQELLMRFQPVATAHALIVPTNEAVEAIVSRKPSG